jgi:hypothetical protein
MSVESEKITKSTVRLISIRIEGGNNGSGMWARYLVGQFGDCSSGLTGGYKITAAWMPRVTFAQSPTCQQTTVQSAVLGNGKLCIFRTTGIEAAMLAQQRANPNFVKTQQTQQQGFHQMPGRCSRSAELTNVCSSVDNAILTDFDEAFCLRVMSELESLIMQSTAVSSDRRKISLAMRLIMFRVTAR